MVRREDWMEVFLFRNRRAEQFCQDLFTRKHVLWVHMLALQIVLQRAACTLGQL